MGASGTAWFLDELCIGYGALGSSLASVVAVILITWLSPDVIQCWGWRVAFLLNSLLGAAVFWARTSVDETRVYREAEPVRARAGQAGSSNRVSAALVFGFTIHWAVCYYMFVIYMSIFMRMHAKLNLEQSVRLTAISTVAIIQLVPLIGRLRDLAASRVRYGYLRLQVVEVLDRLARAR